jgi:hypothetical protein
MLLAIVVFPRPSRRQGQLSRLYHSQVYVVDGMDDRVVRMVFHHELTDFSSFSAIYATSFISPNALG